MVAAHDEIEAPSHLAAVVIADAATTTAACNILRSSKAREGKARDPTISSNSWVGGWGANSNAVLEGVKDAAANAREFNINIIHNKDLHPGVKELPHPAAHLLSRFQKSGTPAMMKRHPGLQKE